ncbi:T9SS C-terminal target domain-containing protein [Brumimicrobium aurantiacum]|uniref:T9SS C-terminal target domain-containing protein n=2 Tax=Brumimicrobium aurantiacum TaxID=1737063 RepID=A0A3E1EX22_9FLAO|nr:T9SS C-terminal target domain-containing protein [Brumimicrobium aurantiacum]
MVHRSNTFNFNVIESGDPGYVQVHSNKRNLTRDGRMIFPVGQNFPSPGGDTGQECGGNFSSITPNTENCTDITVWNDYLDEVESYFSLGNQYGDPNKPKFIRFVAMPWSSSIEFEEKGNYYNRLHYASEIDKLIDLCEEYDGLMIYDLMYQSQFMYRNYYPDWCWEHLDTNGTHINANYPYYCYNDDPGPGGKKPHEMFTNQEDLNYHKQRTRYILSRYGYSTQIYEWELLSEPFHLNSHPVGGSPFGDQNHPEHNIVRNAVSNYHDVISRYIKDSLSWNRQLVGIDMGATANVFDKQSIALGSIDIIGFNPYYVKPNELIVSSNSSMYKFVKDINIERAINDLHPVPVIIPEGGIRDSYSSCSNYDLRSVDEMTLGFTGVAGFHLWNGRAEHTANYIELWKNTFRAQNHMNGDDVINTLSDGWGDWKHGMGKGKLKENDYDDVEAVEMQSYVSSNQEIIVGYIKNRTYNVYTQSSGGICDNVGWNNPGNNPVNSLYNFQWDDIKNLEVLKVDDVLTLKTYDVDFYGDINGTIQYISTDNKLSSIGGKLKLRYPELYVEEHWQNRPVIWFVAKSEDYNGMMQNNDITEDSTDVFLKEFLAIDHDTLTQAPSLKVYPNPFEDYFIVESPVDDEMIIKDPTGRIILKERISSGQNRLQTEALTSGIYFVRFVGQGETFKIVKR